MTDYLMIDWAFPLLAIGIYFATPKGCYKSINLILVCLISFIYGYEEYIVKSVYDSPLHDLIMVCIYLSAASLFSAFGGKIQLYIALSAAIIHIGYGFGWAFIEYPHDYYYRGAFVTLTIIQLLAASKGALWSILYRKVEANERIRHINHASSCAALHKHNP